MTVAEQRTAPASHETAGGRLAFAATTVAAGAASALLATVDPNQPGHYPTCPFLFLTGLTGTALWCPGCGTMRAVHDLLHGDLVGALDRNPLAVAVLPYVVFAWVCWGLRLSGRQAPHPTQLPPRVIWSLLAVVLAFWVLRNVPGWTWLSPA